MIGRLALRSLTAHPVRSAVLAIGFGAGVAVMAILLGVAEVVLRQAKSPELVGGGDVLVRLAPQVPAQLVLAGTLQSDALRSRIAAASPFHTADLYLMTGGRAVRVDARAGIPSRERRLSDAEITQIAAWTNSRADAAWTQETPERVLRQIDRFHPIPVAPRWQSSWGEWLYFNGRAGDTRFYLTFLVGPATSPDHRAAGIRLNIDDGTGQQIFTSSSVITQSDVDRAPDLTIGDSWVRLVGLQYRIHLDVKNAAGTRVLGDLTLDASPGQLVPPIETSGSLGWVTGYVVPVMSGRLGGAMQVGPRTIPLTGGSGYHDHNWGFWQDVTWQWGQVQHEGLSVVYGRVFPPPEAADPQRLPGFAGVLGPDGPLGYATNVQVTETDGSGGTPRRIEIRARGSALDARLQFDAATVTTTPMGAGGMGAGMDFIQLRGAYTVTGRAGSRASLTQILWHRPATTDPTDPGTGHAPTRCVKVSRRSELVRQTSPERAGSAHGVRQRLRDRSSRDRPANSAQVQQVPGLDLRAPAPLVQRPQRFLERQPYRLRVPAAGAPGRHFLPAPQLDAETLETQRAGPVVVRFGVLGPEAVTRFPLAAAGTERPRLALARLGRRRPLGPRLSQEELLSTVELSSWVSHGVLSLRTEMQGICRFQSVNRQPQRQSMERV